MNQKEKFDPKAVVENFHSEIEKLNEALDKYDYSEEAMDNIEKATLKVELQAFKTKVGYQLHKLSKTAPEMTARNVLVQMLNYLPADIKKSFLPELTLFVLKEWDILTTKLAA